jgi:hypothetical protein
MLALRHGKVVGELSGGFKHVCYFVKFGPNILLFEDRVVHFA